MKKFNARSLEFAPIGPDGRYIVTCETIADTADVRSILSRAGIDTRTFVGNREFHISTAFGIDSTTFDNRHVIICNGREFAERVYSALLDAFKATETFTRSDSEDRRMELFGRIFTHSGFTIRGNSAVGRYVSGVNGYGIQFNVERFDLREFGIWLDSERGSCGAWNDGTAVYLDRVRFFTDLAECAEFARKGGERAIFDVLTGNCINVA